MKNKLVIYSIIFLILISSNYCLSNIQIDENLNEKYNLGDMLTTSGKLIFNENILANFKIKLVCSEEETLLMTKIFNIKENVESSFKEELFIPFFYEDICQFKYEIIENNKTIKEVYSNEFNIVKELNVNISTDKKQFQLGESIILKGIVFNLKNEKIDGNALITIKKDKETYQVFSSKINQGELETELGPIFIPNGNYELSINIRDIYGNEKIIENINFEVITKIDFKTTINKEEFLPGEKIEIEGIIENLKEISDNFNLKISLNEYIEEEVIKHEFHHKLKIPNNIQSYENELIVEIFDNFGNKGINKHKINIIPIITTINLETDKKEYIPNEEILISTKLKDQSEEIIYDDIILIIRKNLFKIYEETFNSKTQIKYKIDENLKNEELQLIVKYDKLSDEENIKVFVFEETEENITNKGENKITGNIINVMGDNLNKLGYILIGVILFGILIFVLSHGKLRKEVKQTFSKAKDINKKLKNRINDKHKEKKDLERTFQTYVDPAIAKKIINKDGKLEETKKNITVLFADMRGFTRLTENETPEKVAEQLNVFHKIIGDSVKMYNGIIDQIVGDLTFAIYNVIKEDNNHTLNAIKSALKVKDNISKINKKLKQKNKKLIKLGMGIDQGEVLLSHIGSKNMLKYTAVGNTVNLGSRLQSKAKHNQILITEQTYNLLKNDIEAEDLGYMNFKNISKQVNVFNVIRLK